MSGEAAKILHHYPNDRNDKVPFIRRSWEAAIKLLLISFDSTIKANLSVGLPLDMLAYQKDSFECMYRDRITSEDPYFLSVSNGWREALKSAFDQLPDFKF